MLKTSEEISNVKVYREGPNAINGGLYSYDIINRDTIVLSSKYLPILYFITSDGKIIQQYDLGVDNVDGITEFFEPVNKMTDTEVVTYIQTIIN